MRNPDALRFEQEPRIDLDQIAIETQHQRAGMVLHQLRRAGYPDDAVSRVMHVRFALQANQGRDIENGTAYGRNVGEYALDSEPAAQLEVPAQRSYENSGYLVSRGAGVITFTPEEQITQRSPDFREVALPNGDR